LLSQFLYPRDVFSSSSKYTSPGLVTIAAAAAPPEIGNSVIPSAVSESLREGARTRSMSVKVDIHSRVGNVVADVKLGGGGGVDRDVVHEEERDTRLSAS
jgi:hypothetical protein